MLRAVASVVLGLVLGLGGACRISNEDHCVHKALDADAWCAENVPDTKFCSPCEADEHGCVADRPGDDCPAYTPDSDDTTGATDTTG